MSTQNIYFWEDIRKLFIRKFPFSRAMRENQLLCQLVFQIVQTYGIKCYVVPNIQTENFILFGNCKLGERILISSGFS